MEIYLAITGGDGGPVEVAEEDIEPGLPPDQFQPALVSALRTLGATSGLSTTSQPAATSFRAYVGYAASYSMGSNVFRAVSFMASSSRLYILFGPDQSFSALETSFKVTK